MTYSLADMCKAGRTTERGVRWWESQGLLGEVPRTKGGNRQYTQDHINRAKIIAAGQAAGLALGRISFDTDWIREALNSRISELKDMRDNLPVPEQPEFDL